MTTRYGHPKNEFTVIAQAAAIGSCHRNQKELADFAYSRRPQIAMTAFWTSQNEKHSVLSGRMNRSFR
jgi:hypothetical protein